MEFFPNYRRASFVFSRLMQAYDERRFPYTTTELAGLPQREIPEAWRSMANLYAYICVFMRGRIQSFYAIRRLMVMYAERPELFQPAHVVTLTPEVMETVLTAYIGTLPVNQRYGETWYRLSQSLLAWGGDVLNLFEDVTTPDMLRQRVVNNGQRYRPLREQGFFMFQHKLCSLLAYFLADAGLVPKLRISPPIDFHHVRIMLATEMIGLGDQLTRAYLKPLTWEGLLLAERYLQEHPEVDSVDFANPMWLLSSRVCARSVKDGPDPLDWSHPATQQRFQSTCNKCPIERQCQYWIPSKSNYRRGDDARSTRVIELLPRPKPPRRIRLHQT